MTSLATPKRVAARVIPSPSHGSIAAKQRPETPKLSSNPNISSNSGIDHDTKRSLLSTAAANVTASNVGNPRVVVSTTRAVSPPRDQPTAPKYELHPRYS
jgi:hypothetical protein